MAVKRGESAMAYEASGAGEALILVPGGLTGWISWVPHAERLAAIRQVFRLQLLNVALGLAGESLPPGYSVAHEVAALSNTLDKLGIERADMAGWSYGGEIALSYAIHNPQRVRSLTLIEPAAYWVLRSRGLLSLEILAGQEFWQSVAGDSVSGDQLVSILHGTGLLPEDLDPRTLPQWPIWYEHRQSLRIADAPYRHEDQIELVRQFEKPVLLVKGEGGDPDAHETMDVLAREFPAAQVITLPGGHAAHIASMERFLDHFSAVLSGDTPGRSS